MVSVVKELSPEAAWNPGRMSVSNGQDRIRKNEL